MRALMELPDSDRALVGASKTLPRSLRLMGRGTSIFFAKEIRSLVLLGRRIFLLKIPSPVVSLSLISDSLYSDVLEKMFLVRSSFLLATLGTSAGFVRPALGQAAKGCRSSGTCAAAAFDIASTVAGSDVVVFSKSYCPFCAKTKSLFESIDVNAKVIELDLRDDGASIQADLKTMTGQGTVPNVFIKGKHLGGNDDTQKAHASGKLKELLA